jgi:hypothetical protein
MKQIFSRFKSIFKPDFLFDFLNKTEENKFKSTLKFWVVLNLGLVLIFSFWQFNKFYFILNEFNSLLNNYLKELKIEIKDDQLSLAGINEPFLYKNKKYNFVFVIDTEKTKYNKSILTDYNHGILITKDNLIRKQNFLYNNLTYDELRESLANAFDFLDANNFKFEINQETLKKTNQMIQALNSNYKILVFIFILILNLFQFFIYNLVGILFWSIIAYFYAKLLKIKNLKFKDLFLFTLNIYFIPIIVSALLLYLFKFELYFANYLMMIVILGFNFYYLRKYLPKLPK